jgi:hypothetical protein
MMKHLYILGLAAGLSLASLAHASVTYTFATSNQQVAQGSTYCPTYSTSCSSSTPTVGVYAEQTSGVNGTFVTPVNVVSGPIWNQTITSTESGLFTVTDSPNNYGTGIAPFNPTEGAGTFSGQNGITDTASGANGNDNILLLKLSNFSAGSTLSLLLQAGVSGDSFTVYTSTGAMPTSLSGMSKYDANPINVDEPGSIKSNGSSQPTTPQLSGLAIAGLNSSTTGWIAIQADCHYMLLDTLSVIPGTATPEPRFYGLLLATFLGLAGTVYQKRRVARTNA